MPTLDIKPSTTGPPRPTPSGGGHTGGGGGGLAAFAAAITHLGDCAEQSGPKLALMTKGFDDLTAASDKAAAKLSFVEAQADLAALALSRVHHAGDAAAESNREIAQSAVAAGNSYEALSGSVGKANEAFLASGKGMATMTIMNMTLVKATQGAIDKFHEWTATLGTTGAAIDKLTSHEQNLLDFMANAKAAYDSGIQSLEAYNATLEMTIEQLEKMAMSASRSAEGVARIRKMIDAIREMQKAALNSPAPVKPDGV